MVAATDRLYVDRRLLAAGTAISWDIARHIFTRYEAGTIAVAATNPVATLAAVRKQWKRVVRQVQQERARTLNPTRIMELSRLASTMQTLLFGITPDARVYFATREQLKLAPPACRTLYVAVELDEQQLAVITSAMPDNAVVVLYARQADAE